MKIKGGQFLVTGGAGFIGSNLVRFLLEKEAKRIVVFDNFLRGTITNLDEELKNSRVSVFSGNNDLRDFNSIKEACKEIDGVFHLASLCLAHCQKEPRMGFDINVVGTHNLLEACSYNGIKRVMFASSSSVYGNAMYTPIDEEHPFNNKNHYGASKIACEALFNAFHHSDGIEFINYRLMNVYGPKQDYLGVYVAVIMKIIDRVLKNQSPFIYGDGTQSFDFIYVDDVCKSFILGMESKYTNEVFNISSGVKTSINEIAKLILTQMNSDLKIEYRTNNDNTLVTDRVGSTIKAKTKLGFYASIPLEEGLRKVIYWKKEQQNMI